MKTNKEFINGIYEKFDEYSKEKKVSKQNNINKILNIAAVFAIIFSSIIVFSNQEEEKIITEQGKVQQTKINLKTVGTFENLYNIIKVKNVANEEKEIVIEDLATNGTMEETKRSETNTQVENVDESDVVKVDEKYIYYVSDNKIVIIDAQNPETSEKIAEINYEEDKFLPREIYIKNNKLIVLGNESEEYTSVCKTAITDDVGRPLSYKTGIILYDISNIKEPKEIRRVMVEGSLISSRMIENNIYFVANKNIYTATMFKNQLEDLDQNEYKPKYKDTAINNEEKCIEYNRIYCIDGTQDVNYLMLVGLNIENNNEADIQTFLGAGEYIYASEKNMYIATNKITYGEGYKVLGGTTRILKFGLENGKFEYKADTEIDGQVNNQFSMDENGDNFRIATTTGTIWNIDKNTSNNLYILNNKLEEVGKITGFAQEEKIYSVRYVKDKAYVVTFKQTDPLFVIDISNSSNPQILGELKIPGYSTYLHPYDETHIIGFGYDTKEDGTRITTNGLKMVMFDISDYNNPKELFKIAIGDKYTYSSLTYNHKALLYSKEKNIIGFPVYSSLNNKTNSRAAIYEIDLEKGFTLKGEIANITNEYKEEVERVVFTNDSYYTLSKALVKVAKMDTLEIVKEIKI